MTPKYRFYLQADDGEKVVASPIYSDDLSLNYELESDQEFYRAKLSGEIAFIREDYDFIMAQPFETTYYLHIEKSNDFGRTFSAYYTAKFSRTDCTINEDDKKITVQTDVVDEYSNVLAGLDKEYNLIELKPEIERLYLQKRPLIQIYVAGDSVVSCFLGGTTWEQDAEEILDETELTDKYKFALCSITAQANVRNPLGSQIGEFGVYAGSSDGYTSLKSYEVKMYPAEDTGYYMYVKMLYTGAQVAYYEFTAEIRLAATDAAAYRCFIRENDINDIDLSNVELKPTIGTGASAFAQINIANVFARYLCDVETFLGVPTAPIPTDDIVENNRGYKRAVGYKFNVIYPSSRTSTEPTEYGKTDNNDYFMPPYVAGVSKFYPIARSTWRYASLWFAYHALDKITEEAGRKTYILRDAFPVSSVISVLLKQFAPDITHEATPEYSEFLYGDENPVSGRTFRLYVSQKSNLLNGDYQVPALKAPTTLGEFLDMLRDCFHCYWHIENNRLRIEHISWYRKGGSYTGTGQVGIDLTEIENINNGKKWAFATSQYSYNKPDMPERYEFEWMDEVTDAFKGSPIEVISKYVTQGNIEEVSISNFTTDVDMMILNTGNMSTDGFALFAATPANAIKGPATTSGADGTTTPKIAIRPEFVANMAKLTFTASGGGTAAIVFFNGDTELSSSGSYPADNTTRTVDIEIPSGADGFAFKATGSFSAVVQTLVVPSKYELPIVEKRVDGVEYYLQNGYMAMIDLQPTYMVDDLPAKKVKINGAEAFARGIARNKTQEVSFPVGMNDPDPLKLIKTSLGVGDIDKISVNLSERMAKATLRYDTE